MKETIIGIDLGTTNSMAAVVGESGVVIIENDKTTSCIASVVLCDPDGKLVVEQKDATPKHHNRKFYSFKKFMGRSVDDFSEEKNQFSYQLSQGENKTILLSHNENKFSPEALSAVILKHIKEQAETVLQMPLNKAVITVPAYFDDTQRQATKNAAQIAGLDVVRMMNEPTAAALAYGLQEKKVGKILVYDFGGGTLDVSILELKQKLFKVLSTNGNTNLGGDNIDDILVQALKKKYFHAIQIEQQDNHTIKRLAEQIKINLTNRLEYNETVQLNQQNIEIKITRDEFEQIIQPIIEQTLDYVMNALQDAGLDKTDIDEIVLVGGSIRVPLVQKKLQDYFQKPLNLRINPDKAIALGAGIQAFTLAGGKRDYLLLDVIPLSLGIETIGGTFSKLIMKNSSTPAKKVETFSTSVDHQTAIEINVYQGEREFVKDCRLLGKFKIKIPPMLAGLPRLAVQFLVDTNGMLIVSATEERSGQTTEIEIIPEHGLNQDTVKEMILSSIDNAESDFEQRNLVEFRIKAKQMLLSIDKNWKYANSFLKEEQSKQIQEQCEKVKSAIQQDSVIQLNQEMTVLGDLTREFSDQIMSAAVKQGLTS